MISLTKTNSKHKDFIALVKLLDADLAKRDGEEHDFYAQYNKIDTIKYAIVAYENAIPIGCGAIKEYAPKIMEVKRMYLLPEKRGAGTASKILNALELWAAALSYHKCILETGKKQPEAVRLYQKNGYKLMPNYGQYAGIDNSLCFEKEIKTSV